MARRNTKNETSMSSLGREFDRHLERYHQIRDPHSDALNKVLVEVERRTGIDRLRVTELRDAESFVDAARAVSSEQGFKPLDEEMSFVVTALGRIASDIILTKATDLSDIKVKATAVAYRCETLWCYNPDELDEAGRAIRDLVESVLDRTN